jgi:recombination protein RecR
MEFSSKLLERAVGEVSLLPGIGKRTALRLVLHLLRQPEHQTKSLAESLVDLRTQIKYCKSCHNISDTDLCEICKNPKRLEEVVCIVEDIRDVMAIENTGQFNGLYHVLGGKISPLEGIGPQQLKIDSLIHKISKGHIQEVILALSATIEGDTTNFYIYKLIKNYPIRITTIAKGVSVGDALEYTDEVTLGRSINQRLPFQL